MGRPLNKKYFGNRNIGSTSTTADNGIGGAGVASVTIGGTNNAYVAVPSVTFANTPKLPNGVRATGTAVMGVVGVTLVAPGTGYAVNDVITIGAGAGAGTPATLTVTAITGGGATGPIATVSIATAGNYTTITDVSAVGVTGPGNDDATFDLTFKVNSITITEKGSGYTAAPAITMAGNATKTAVLEVDTGAVGSATNNENAIVIYANVTGSGSTGAACDIIRQVSTNRYKVTDGTYTKIVQLGTDDTPEDGEAYIVATATGGTYFVTKLTSRKATLVTKTGDGALNGKSVPWTFSAGTATTVQIENV